MSLHTARSLGIRERRLRVHAVIVAGLVGVVAWTAAGGASAATRSPTALAPASVSIGSFVGVGPALPNDIAKGLGLFASIEKKFNTKFDFPQYTLASPMVSGISQHQLAFVIYSEANNILATAQGISNPAVNLMGMSQGGSIIIAAPTSLKAKYGTGLPALLKFAQDGAVIANTAAHNSTELAADALFVAAGFPDVSKLNWVETGAAGIGPAVVSGRATVALLPVSQSSLITSGQLYNVLYASGATAFKAVGYFSQTGFQGDPQFLAQYPALTQAVVNAELIGLRYIQQHYDTPGDIYNLMPSSFRATTSLQDWTTSWPWVAGQFAPVTGLIGPSEINRVAALMKKYGLVSSSYTTPPARVMVNDSFVLKGYKMLKKVLGVKSVPRIDFDPTIAAKVPN